MDGKKKPKAEKMPEKVFLTVGRHGRYSYGARLPLSESSILEGVYRGQELTAAYGSFDAVYSSDIPRAKATDSNNKTNLQRDAVGRPLSMRDARID